MFAARTNDDQNRPTHTHTLWYRNIFESQYKQIQSDMYIIISQIYAYIIILCNWSTPINMQFVYKNLSIHLQIYYIF